MADCDSGTTVPKRVLRVSEWYARLGNNFQQISHALYAGEQLNAHVTFPRHNNALLQRLCAREHPPPEWAHAGDGSRNAIAVASSTFFDGKILRRNGVEPPSCNEVADVLRRRVAPLLQLVPVPKDVDVARALVAHIRSGDIFGDNNSTAHCDYWQPPLAWYVHIAQRHRADHGDDAPLVVVTEPDMRNPVIGELRKRGWTIRSRSVAEDFSLIAQAPHVACSFGSFSTMAVLVSTAVRTVYVASWPKPNGHRLSTWRADDDTVAASGAQASSDARETVLDVRLSELSDYAGVPWRNHPDQRRLMLEYEMK